MEPSYLKNIFIIMVEPKNAGNIGASARAMKNMGINNLRLVNPCEFKESEEQKKLAYRSQEIIHDAKVFPTLSAALVDISTVFLTTSRQGKWKRDFLTPDQAAQIILERQKKEKVALLFGREDFGVTIDESQMANFCVYIPSAIRYPSLNLSQAVMISVYEIFKNTSIESFSSFNQLPKRAEKRTFERLIDNIWDLMKSLEINEEENGLFHRSLKRAFNRAFWTNADIAVLDRLCKQVRWFLNLKYHPEGKE